MAAIVSAMMLPALSAAKDRAQTINCVSNEKQLALAVRIYAGDNTNHFPSAASWCDDIKTMVGSEKVFKCPSANPADQCDYAFNAALGGMDQDKVDPRTVMIFESDAGWNAHGGADSMVTPARHQHGRRYVVAFADGSVQEIGPSQLDTLRWNP
jgi:prepilin-type processing-associated H-X9-DG protein